MPSNLMIYLANMYVSMLTLAHMWFTYDMDTEKSMVRNILVPSAGITNDSVRDGSGAEILFFPCHRGVGFRKLALEFFFLISFCIVYSLF